MPEPTVLPTAGSSSIHDQLTLSRELQVSHELVLRFCGEPGVYRAAGDRIPLGRKATALLAYLLLEPRVHARQQLSGLLWPESDENAAATSLRQALSKLREVLGSKLYTDRTSVSLDTSDSLLQSDVGEFSMLVDSDPLAALQVDIGAFLSQLTVGDAAEYEQWVERTRTRMVRQAIDALRSAAQESVARRDWMRVSQLAEQWQRLDMESQAAASLAIEAAFMRRDAEAGRALFNEFCSRHETEASPVPEPMRAMMQRLESLAAGMTPAHGSIAVGTLASRTATVRSTSLQERDDSWRVLSEAFARVEQQRRSELFLIRGEAGVGRSRLLEDTIAWTSARGATVLHARLALSNVALSYATLGALLRSGIDAPGLGGIDGVYLRELMTLVPELSSRFRGIERSPSTSGVPGWSLLDAVSQALRAMGEDAPVVIAIDDATWCDRESGGVLQSLVEQLSHEPILWLATMSEDDASTASTLPAFLSTHATQLTLESLTALSIGAIVRESSELDAEWNAFADSVHAVTHGVPALVHAVLAQMLAEYGGDWQSVRLATATVPVPEPANAMVRRIDSLSDMEREVLIALALLVEGLQLAPDEWKETPSLTPHLLSHVHGISRLRAARIGESLVELRLARVSNGGLQCVSPVIAQFMVTNGSSIMRDELRRRLRHVRR